jgi:ubiquitin-activating enzyme E1
MMGTELTVEAHVPVAFCFIAIPSCLVCAAQQCSVLHVLTHIVSMPLSAWILLCCPLSLLLSFSTIPHASVSVFRFAKLFNHSTQQLLLVFPSDMRGADGRLFWSGTKRVPSPVEFDASDAVHVEFVASAATLWGSVYNMDTKQCSDLAWVARVAQEAEVPSFVSQAGIKIAADEEELKKQQEEQAAANAASATAAAADAAWDVDGQFKEVLRDLPSRSSLEGFSLAPIVWDKDNKLHMRVVAAASNLRARGYGIVEATLQESKLVAGRITPAIATTTSLVAGLVCVELLKVVQGAALERHRNAFLNLATPQFTQAEPMACSKMCVTIPPGAPFVPSGMDPASVGE